MSDKTREAQGNYQASSHEALKAFIDNAVNDRLEQLKQDDISRSNRFKADAERLRAAFREHESVPPDPKTFDVSDNLAVWNEQLLELERKAQTAERQHRIHLKAMENPNMDLLKRQARRFVSEHFPEQYAAYQESVKSQRLHKLLSDLSSASEHVDQLIIDKATPNLLKMATNKLNDIVVRAEKSKLFDIRATDAQRSMLAQCKSKAAQISVQGHDRGLQR